MNQFAPVCNLETYRRLFGEDIGNYQLLIATEIMKRPNDWGDFWRGEIGTLSDGYSDSGQFIILDNGLIETGKAADHGVLKAAAEVVGASCVVLPDSLGNFRATLTAVAREIWMYKKLDLPLMGVVQGQDIYEAEELMKWYVENEVEYLSIPRVMVEFFGTRRFLVERARWYGKSVHLLGWSDNVNDDLQCAGMEGVIGIDSAVPIWYPQHFMPIPPTNTFFGRRPKDFWIHTPDGNDMERIEANIRWTRRWIEYYVKGVLTAQMPGTLQD